MSDIESSQGTMKICVIMAMIVFFIMMVYIILRLYFVKPSVKIKKPSFDSKKLLNKITVDTDQVFIDG